MLAVGDIVGEAVGAAVGGAAVGAFVTHESQDLAQYTSIKVGFTTHWLGSCLAQNSQSASVSTHTGEVVGDAVTISATSSIVIVRFKLYSSDNVCISPLLMASLIAVA